MAKRRKKKSSRGTVKFSTRRGRKVSFKLTGRGHRRKTKWTMLFKKASASCRRKRGVKPFTKAFGKCMKSYYKQHA